MKQKKTPTDRRELQPDGWTKAPWTVLLNPDITPTEKTVLLVLLSHDGARGMFPSYTTIAHEAGCGKRTVQRTVERLQQRGLLAIRKMKRRGGGFYHRYTLTLPSGQNDHPRVVKMATELDTGELDTESLLHDHSSSDRTSCTTTLRAAAEIDADARQATSPAADNLTADPDQPSVAVAAATEAGDNSSTNPGPFNVTQRMQLITDITRIAASVRDSGYWSDETCDARDEFATHLKEYLEPGIYEDLYADFIDNDKWTFSAKCVNRYEAGKKLNTLIHTINLEYGWATRPLTPWVPTHN